MFRFNFQKIDPLETGRLHDADRRTAVGGISWVGTGLGCSLHPGVGALSEGLAALLAGAWKPGSRLLAPGCGQFSLAQVNALSS